MTWEDLGYNKFLTKPKPAQIEYSDSDFDLLVRDISADKITSGVSQSKTLKIDYNAGQITKAEGNITRLEIGKFTDGKFGMRVYDSSGTTVIDQTS